MPILTGKLCRLRPLTRADASVSLPWRQDAETREQVMGYRLPVTETGEADWYERVKSRPSYGKAVSDWVNLDYLALMKEKGAESWPKVKQIIDEYQ